jgi:putative nucleotidyltransferase with HDIG domain
MQLVELRRKYDIDVKGIESLLSHLSQLLGISIDIKNPEGESMIRGNNNLHGISCCLKEAALGKCVAERLDFFRQIETSGQTKLQTNCDNIEIIGIPLKCNQDLVGILCACWKAGEGSSGQRSGAFLEEIANRISYEIQSQFEIKSLTSDLSNKYEELNLVYNVAKELGKITTAEKTIKFIVEHAQISLESDAAIISIPSKHILEKIGSSSSRLPFDINNKPLIAKISEIVMKELTSSDQHAVHIRLDGACDNTLPAELLHVSVEILAVPIKLKNLLVGSLSLINFNTEKTFEAGNMRLLGSLAKQISLVITNTELYQDLKDILLNVIKTLVYSIEAKDSYTRGHSERVSTIALKIAEDLGLSGEAKDELKWASILHDIGKIGVPEIILNKTGTLNKEEFQHIKEHPEKGYEILNPINQLNESVKSILYHHERYDGTGYPSGLKGKKIPLYARVIAIADTYDAMTSRRSYRRNISRENAIAEIIKVKGTQLDPELVEIFLKII